MIAYAIPRRYLRWLISQVVDREITGLAFEEEIPRTYIVLKHLPISSVRACLLSGRPWANLAGIRVHWSLALHSSSSCSVSRPKAQNPTPGTSDKYLAHRSTPATVLGQPAGGSDHSRLPLRQGIECAWESLKGTCWRQARSHRGAARVRAARRAARRRVGQRGWASAGGGAAEWGGGRGAELGTLLARERPGGGAAKPFEHR